jgi:hypothetical protein
MFTAVFTEKSTSTSRSVGNAHEHALVLVVMNDAQTPRALPEARSRTCRVIRDAWVDARVDAAHVRELDGREYRDWNSAQRRVPVVHGARREWATHRDGA